MNIFVKEDVDLLFLNYLGLGDNFRLGLEYARLTTVYAEAADDDEDDVGDDRVQFSAWYNF